jgi:hypothetical protein
MSDDVCNGESAPAPDGRADLTEDLAQAILEAGLDPAAALLQAIEPVVDDHATRRAGELLRLVLRSMKPSPDTIAIARLLLGDRQSLRGAAGQAKCSKTAIWRAERDLRAALAGQPLSK